MSARPGINFANIDINNSLLGVTQSVESGGPITFMGAKSLNGIGGVHDREVVLAALERYHAASSSVPSTQPSPGSHGHYGISSHRGHVGSSVPSLQPSQLNRGDIDTLVPPADVPQTLESDDATEYRTSSPGSSVSWSDATDSTHSTAFTVPDDESGTGPTTRQGK